MSIMAKRPGSESDVDVMLTPTATEEPLTVRIVRTSMAAVEYNDTFTCQILFSEEITQLSYLHTWYDDADIIRVGSVSSNPETTVGAAGYTITITPPSNSSGTVTISVDSASTVEGKMLSNSAALTISYDVRVPDVTISKSGIVGRIRTEAVIFNFTWDQEVAHASNLFELTDINFNITSTEGDAATVDMDSFTGPRDLNPALSFGPVQYSVSVDIPANSLGTIQISIGRNAAAAIREVQDADGMALRRQGPPALRTETFEYDRSTAAPAVMIPPANLIIRVPLENPYRYTVATITFIWDHDVTEFALEDISATLGTFSNLIDLGEQTITGNIRHVYEATLTLPAGQTSMTTVTVSANSARSGGAATDNSPPADVSETFNFDTTVVGLGVVGADETICDHTFSFTDNILGSGLKGAIVGINESKVYNSRLYATIQIQKARENIAELSEQTEGAALLVETDITAKTCRQIKKWDFIRQSARSFVVHDNELHWFEGHLWQGLRQLNEDFLNTMGYLWKINTSRTISEVGLNWKSAVRFSANQHKTYGTHIGTWSPMVVYDDEIHLISGYGNPLLLGQRGQEINRIDNMHLIKLTDTLDFRIPVLNTNDFTGKEIIETFCRHIAGYQAFINDTFYITPRIPKRAILNTSLTSTQVINSIVIRDRNREIDTKGLFIINDEIFSYSGFDSVTNTLSGIQRSLHSSVAGQHMEGEDIYFVEEVFDLERPELPIKNINDVRPVSNYTQLYNDITVTYDTERKIRDDDEDSINKYDQRREFSINLNLLDRHALEWAQYIRDSFLQERKDLSYLRDIITPVAFHLALGNTVLLKYDKEATTFIKGQTIEIDQRLSKDDLTSVIKTRSF